MICANSNHLLKLCRPIFVLSYRLQNESVEGLAYENFREQVINSLSQLKKLATRQQIDSLHIEYCIYALAAFVDELVLSSSWSARLQWMVKPVQLELFNEHLAGEGFYQRLSNLRQNGERNQQLLAIYYICIELGFEGMYRRLGLERLQALKIELRDQLAMLRGDVITSLDLDFSQPATLHKSYWPKLSVSLIVISTIVMICVMYFCFMFKMTQLAGDLALQLG